MTTSLFDTAWQGSAKSFETVFGKEMVYKRNGIEIPITLSIGSHDIATEEELHWYQSHHAHLWIGATADLVLDGVVFLPDDKLGDSILELNADGTRSVYCVLPTPNGRCYDFFDAEQFQIVICTQLIGPKVAA